jgi:PAP2 superfamily
MARLLVLAPLAVWLAWRRRWRLVVLVVVGGALVGPLNHVLKVIFNRPAVIRRDHRQGGPSYPSGHAAGAVAVATILLVVFWPVLSRAGHLLLVVLAVVGVIVVGYTRVALGAPFTSDVVAGWCVGIAWILLLAVALRVWLGQPDTLRDRMRVRHRQPFRSCPASPSSGRAAAPRPPLSSRAAAPRPRPARDDHPGPMGRNGSCVLIEILPAAVRELAAAAS